MKTVYNKFAVLLIIMALCGLADAGRRGGSNGITLSGSNAIIVKPSDNLVSKYAEIKNNGSMGTLSATNQRNITLLPGTYPMSYTLLMDTDYINVVPLIPGTVTISPTGNSMGIVLLPGVKAVNLVADDRIYKGNYSRPGSAYDGFTLYTDNIPIVGSIPVMGFVTGTSELTNEVPTTGTAMCVQYIATGLSTPKIFGTDTSTKVFESSTGATGSWGASTASAIGTAPVNIGFMWAADDLGNCVFTSQESPPTVWYGTYTVGTPDTLAFTRAKLSGVNFSLASAGGEKTGAAKWSFLRLASGNIILTEYGTGTLDRHIYRSTDKGANWTVAYTSPSGIVNHFHGAGQVLSTGRIVVVCGDGAKAKILYSDNDGVTWADLAPIGTLFIQPISFMDVGHSSKLLCADDTYEGLYLFDVYSGIVTPIFKNQNRADLRGYMWSFARNGKTIYASSFDTTTNGVGTTPVIYATEDLVDWSAIYRISSATPKGLEWIMFFNNAVQGQLAATGSANYAHVTVTPPTIKHHYGVSVEQAVTNQCSVTDASSFEDPSWATYITSSGSQLSQIAAADIAPMKIPHGNKAIKVTNAGTSVLILPARYTGHKGVPVTNGGKYTGSIMVGVPPTGVATQFQINWSDYQGAAVAYGETQYTNVRPGEWKTIYLKPITWVTDAHDELGIGITTLIYTGSTNVLVDEVQICATTEQPSTWQVGGTARAKSIYDLNWQTGEKGTHIFTFCPFANSTWYDVLAGDWYIRSWRVSATVYAGLFYDADDQKFKLIVADGTNTDTLATAAQAFVKGQPLVFCVQFGDNDDTKAHLSVGHGRAIETVNSTNNFTLFGLSNVLVRWGDKDSANGMNGTIYDLDFGGLIAPASIPAYVSSLISN